MIKQMYSIRNDRVKTYWPPLMLNDESEMVQNCKLVVASVGDDFSPEAFSVWYLGTYDTDTATFTAQAPEHVFNIVDM